MRFIVIVLAIVLFSFQAWATPIELASVPFGDLGNAGDGTIQAWLIASIQNYNTTHNPDLPTAPVGAHPDVKVNHGDSPPPGYPSFGTDPDPVDTLSITLPGNLNDYLVLHWGGPGGGLFQAFDLTTIPEDEDLFESPFQDGKQYGLSFYSFYGEGITPIPEPATMVLIGSGLIGLAGYGRKRFFKK